MAGTGPTHGSGLRTPPKQCGSTRSGPLWGGSTALMATGTWFAVVLRWRRMNKAGQRSLPRAIERGGSGSVLHCAPPSHWQLWNDETPRPGWANMAIDQTLLERAEQLGERCL